MIPEQAKAVLALLVEKTRSQKVKWKVDDLGDDYYYARLPDDSFSITLTEDRPKGRPPTIRASILNDRAERVYLIRTENEDDYLHMKTLLESAAESATAGPEVLDGIEAALRKI